jgi:hypothetical protein
MRTLPSTHQICGVLPILILLAVTSMCFWVPYPRITGDGTQPGAKP